MLQIEGGDTVTEVEWQFHLSKLLSSFTWVLSVSVAFLPQIAGGDTVTEVEVDEKLTARRAAQPGFNDCSFPTIAGAPPDLPLHPPTYRPEARNVSPDRS